MDNSSPNMKQVSVNCASCIFVLAVILTIASIAHYDEISLSGLYFLLFGYQWSLLEEIKIIFLFANLICCLCRFHLGCSNHSYCGRKEDRSQNQLLHAIKATSTSMYQLIQSIFVQFWTIKGVWRQWSKHTRSFNQQSAQMGGDLKYIHLQQSNHVLQHLVAPKEW